jgi:gluconokinase
MQLIIAVDIGTTSTRAVVFDFKGEVLAAHYQEYPTLHPEPTHSEQRPEDILKAVIETLRKAIGTLTAADTLVGISFSSAMHSLLAVDAQGNPLTNFIIWADNRSQVIADELRASPAGQDIYQHTGTPIHPMSPLCKLAWLQQHQPEIHQTAHKFISLKEYIWFKFFGTFQIDYSIASATGLFDIYTHTWYAPALAVAQITPDQLSEPVNTLHQGTNLNPAIARELGLTQPVPVIIGASDGCLANLGSGASELGEAALTIGTSGAIRITAPRPAQDVRGRLFNYILTPDQYIVGGPVNNGGVVLRWFRDNFYATEKAAAQKEKTSIYDLMSEQAATVPAGAQGLLFLPYLLGERAPVWDAQARGSFFGLGIMHGRPHLLRAVYEGIIYGIYEVAQAVIATTGPIRVIYASGGFARSPFWVQMVADIFNLKVIISQTVESSAWGAALLGLQAIQPGFTFKETTEPAEEYLPDPEQHARYMQNFTIFEKLYPLLKEEMAAIGALQH